MVEVDVESQDLGGSVHDHVMVDAEVVWTGHWGSYMNRFTDIVRDTNGTLLLLKVELKLFYFLTATKPRWSRINHV